MAKRCKWLAVTPDKDGVVRVRKSYSYRCDYPELEAPKLPVSVTESFGWRWPPSRTHITASACLRCPVREDVNDG